MTGYPAVTFVSTFPHDFGADDAAHFLGLPCHTTRRSWKFLASEIPIAA
jgi:hypothetical protein